ncbi:MAG: dTMP kinase [bacterium]
MSKGLFITLEGSDGGGKSTQAAGLCLYLRRKGYKIVHTREPGGTCVSEKLRAILLDPKNRIEPESEILLYEAIRAQHVRELLTPALDKGYIVVCERFSDATLAYQGYGRGHDKATIKKIDRFATKGLTPDLTFLLDIDPGIGMRRLVRGAKKKDRIEKEALSFHRRVRQGYLDIARKNPKRFFVINALGAEDEIHEQICAHAQKVITRRKIKPGRK